MESLNPLDQLQAPVIIAVIVIVALTYVLLRRVFFAPYVRVMEERDTKLEAAEAVIAEADAALADAEPETQRLLASARERADEILRVSQEEDAAYRRDVIDAAMNESSTSLERGSAELGGEREREAESLREKAIECVTLACEKLLGSSHPDVVSAAVDKQLARRGV